MINNNNYNILIEDIHNYTAYDLSSSEIEKQIEIRMIALDLLKNWNAIRSSGNTINSEMLFSIEELSEFFYINKSKKNNFEDILVKLHNALSSSEDIKNKFISYLIGDTIYFCVPNLMKLQWFIDRIIPLSNYYENVCSKKHENNNIIKIKF